MTINKLRNIRKQFGVCIDCGKKKEQLDKTRCDRCLLLGRIRTARTKTNRRANNVCIECGKPLSSYIYYCDKCNILNNKRKKRVTQKRKDEGRCTTCGVILIDMGGITNAKFTCINCSETIHY